MAIPIRLIAALVVLLVACDDTVTDPPRLDPPALSPATQWAGGTVRVTAPTIDSADVAPPLRLNQEELEVVAVGDGWADYRLPTTGRGVIELVLRGEQPDTFEIQLLGFRDAEIVDVALRGNLFVWPRTGEASVLGIASDNSGVIQLLPEAGTADYLIETPIFSEARSVGPTYDPDLLLIPDGHAQVWSMASAPHVVDTLPVPFSRHAMLLSDSIYVSSWHHGIDVIDPANTVPFLYMGQYEETQGMVISPSGRYGGVLMAGSALGVPVFSAESGEPVFHVEMMSHSDGVDFSPVGDTLHLAGMRATEPRHHVVLAVDATTGELLDTVEIPAFNPVGLRRDPNGPWLFVAVALPNAPPSMLVIDTRTMEIAGEMATEGYLGCVGACEAAVAVGPEGVYVVITAAGAATTDDPATVLSFDGGAE